MAVSQDRRGVDEGSSPATDVFGPAGSGVTDITARARQSKGEFVRSQVQVARWSENTTGKLMYAFEALEAFGWSTVAQLADKRAATVVEDGCEAAIVLRTRREAMALSIQQVAKQAGLAEADVRLAEAGTRKTPIRVLLKLTQALALDHYRIGTSMGGGGDPALGVRLREAHGGPGSMSAAVVLGLAEAAWVIATQSRLERWLDGSRTGVPTRLGFAPMPMREVRRPAWREGMDLAHRARELLDIGQDGPIRGLMALLGDRLAIPVVQVDLPGRFAGATIANGSARGVAVNVNGINENVWTRRMTVTHELGHLLWDSDEDLNRLRVDKGDAIEGDPQRPADRVETRANAFAAEFLAPQAAVARLFAEAGRGPAAVSMVMQRFGISFTAAKWQIHNGLGRLADKPDLRSVPGTRPSDAWEADETSTGAFFVLKETPIPRRGRFAELCLEAYDQHLISPDTAADHLGTDPATFLEKVQELRSLFARP